MPDETEPTPPPAPQLQPSGGAYSQGEKISKINVADEIMNSFLDYSMSASSIFTPQGIFRHPNANNSLATLQPYPRRGPGLQSRYFWDRL